MGRSARLVLILGAMLGAAACKDAGSPVAARPSAPEASMDRRDDHSSPGIGSGASGGFYFLPPIADEPRHHSTFDRTLSPEVRICVWTGTACGTVVADFTRTSGTGGVRVRVDGDKYQVVWSSKECVWGRCTLDPSKAYRIQVLLGTTVIGFADVVIASRGGGRDARHDACGEDDDHGDGHGEGRGRGDDDDDDDACHCRGGDGHDEVRMRNGSSLPIKFRIEQGLALGITVSPPPATVPVGTKVPLTAIVKDPHGDPVTTPITWTSSDNSIAVVDQNGVVTPVGVGTVVITATAGDLTGTATLNVSSPNVPGCLPPPAGLISWYTGDGTTADLKGASNGTAGGGLTYVPGLVGQALQFNGQDAYVNIPYIPAMNFSPTGQFTMEGWVNPGEQNSFEALFVKSPDNGHWDYGLYLNPNNDHQVFVYAYTPNTFMSGYNLVHVVSSQTSTVIGQWFHVAVAYDNGNWTLYVNGVAQATRTGEFITQSTGGMALGKKGEANFDFFHGALDEMSLYGRALTPVEIAAIAAAGGAGKCKG
ncbi:MAG: cell wall/surface repeat protein [Gemmatimonadetes bacterium]|nr:cell wall/surface repeat protein [Gemmatimonadota bacterium]